MAAIVVLVAGFLSACGPTRDTGAQMNITVGTAVPGSPVSLNLSNTRMSPGKCLASIKAQFFDPPGMPWANGRPETVIWTNSNPLAYCDSMPTGISAPTPVDFMGGTVSVTLTSYPTLFNDPDSWYYASQLQDVSVDSATPPVAKVFATDSPLGAGTTLDARQSYGTDTYDGLTYSWDLNQDGIFGDSPRTAIAGTAKLRPLSGTPLSRFQACAATTDAFVSAEAAPEITGPVPLGAGYLRLWDDGVAWRDVNPQRGQFDWATLDMRIAQAEQSGSKVLYVMGLTPGWAATDPSAGDPRWGAGSASPPANINDWKAFVTALGRRYGDRISAYELWNEANLQTFWTGSPAEMASLNKAAYDILKALAPHATLLAPSVTTRLGSVDLFEKSYLDAAATVGYPFDAFAIHSYPAGSFPSGNSPAIAADQRIDGIERWQTVVSTKLGDSAVLDKPVWDTEVNYGLAGPGKTPPTSYSDADAAQLIQRTYADSKTLGIDATFWYLYTAGNYPLVGAQLNSGTPATLAAYAAARTAWAPGAGACTPAADATTGRVRVSLADGGPSSIASITVPHGPRPLTSVDLVWPQNVADYTNVVTTTLNVQGTGVRSYCVREIGNPWFQGTRYFTGTTSFTNFNVPILEHWGRSVVTVDFSSNDNAALSCDQIPGYQVIQTWQQLYNKAEFGFPATPMPRTKKPVTKKVRTYTAPAQLALATGSSILSKGEFKPAGYVANTIIGGTYTWKAPVKSKGARRPAGLTALSKGTYVMKLDRYGQTTSANGKDSVVAAIGTALLRGAKGSLACMQLNANEQGTSFQLLGGTGLANGMTASQWGLPAPMSARGPESLAGQKGTVTAGPAPKQKKLPAVCRPLVSRLKG